MTNTWTLHEADDSRVVDERGNGIANAYGGYDGKLTKRRAVLISAAPDMQAAGKNLLERLASYRSDEEWPQAMREAIADMRRAIKKSGGR